MSDERTDITGELLASLHEAGEILAGTKPAAQLVAASDSGREGDPRPQRAQGVLSAFAPNVALAGSERLP